MSLEIGWLNEHKNEEMYEDVEALFGQVEIKDTPEVRKVLQLIEKSTYYNNKMFTDRFGGNLYYSSLSTGCKAALLLLLGDWDRWVSLVEIGYDACSVIVSFCRYNKILLRSHVTSFVAYSQDIDVVCDGERFLKHDDFTLHILESWRG